MEKYFLYLTLIMSLRGEGGHIGFSVDPVDIGIGIPLLVPMISLEPMGEISPNLHGYIIRTS